jgi:hypothetical protein
MASPYRVFVLPTPSCSQLVGTWSHVGFERCRGGILVTAVIVTLATYDR